MSVLQSFDLTGKTALVTGCKRGIGRGMAEALASAGADIIGVSASLELSGSDVEKAVTAMGRSFGLTNATSRIALRCMRLLIS